MSFSDIFHPESDPVEPHDAPNHVVFSCVQWKTPNLEIMPRAAKQSFAVMYGDTLNPYVTAALERAYILGAMSAVKLIAVHEDQLYLFLDSEVSSTTFREIETLWTNVIGMGRILLAVDFASVSEVYSGRSVYLFWQDAKKVLESYTLDIEQYELLALDDFSDDGFIDEDMWFRFSPEHSGQPQGIPHCPVEIPNFADMMGHSKCPTSPYYIPLHYRKPDV